MNSVHLQEKKQEPVLTRQQKRALDRIQKDANDVFGRIINQLLDYILEDVDLDMINTKKKEADAKWRLYCSRKGLNPKVYNLMDLECNKMLKEYQKYNDSPGN